MSEKSPNSKLGTAVIGVVNQGKPAVAAACTERLVALCDVDESHTAQAKQFIAGQNRRKLPVKLSSVAEFYDYRKMFDKIHKQIDAVFIAVPDHHHALASLIAMRLGKHVYCEKPMAHSIAEVRLMMKTARDCKVVTQLGNHHHSSESVRRLCEYIWAGAIGNVTETYSWARTRPRRHRRTAAGRARAARACTGTNGSGRPPIATTTRSCIPSSGGAGGSSATARWAIGAATISTASSWP